MRLQRRCWCWGGVLTWWTDLLMVTTWLRELHSNIMEVASWVASQYCGLEKSEEFAGYEALFSTWFLMTEFSPSQHEVVSVLNDGMEYPRTNYPLLIAEGVLILLVTVSLCAMTFRIQSLLSDTFPSLIYTASQKKISLIYCLLSSGLWEVSIMGNRTGEGNDP